MYVKETDMTYAKCENWDKPGKNEIPKSIINWDRMKRLPEADRKRTRPVAVDVKTKTLI